ncbi:hypothetical protein [Streptomyces sp. NPDC058955]|uniref:hypothetical protein n=1 Tax=unclassified Streptomyces TaxID=2593676 RepID=UPI003647124E
MTAADPDRRARLVAGGCFGVVVGGLVSAVVAMLLMSVAITAFFDRDGRDAKPVPMPSR